MSNVLAAGLVVSLLGAPASQWVAARLGFDPVGRVTRLGQWALALAIIAIAATGVPDWTGRLGLASPGWGSLGWGLGASVLVLGAWPGVQRLQRALGGRGVEDTAQFRRIAAFSLGYRAFLVVTAGTTEEVLYRGYAIGIGAVVLGSTWMAFILSLAVFTVSHVRWGASHLVSVLWAGGMLSVVFVFTHDLWACMLAHVLIDAVGLLLAPAAMARRRTASDPPDP